MLFKLVKSALLILLTILLCSCQTHRTGELSAPLPEKFSNIPQMGTERKASSLSAAKRQGPWWENFHDPALNRLVRQTLSGNLSLMQARARLDQAKALADQAGASWWPRITVEARSNRTRTNVPEMPPATGTQASYSNQYFTSAAASYELDLWGRIASLDRAAEMDVRASWSDLEVMTMSLAAEVAETWFSIIEQQTILDLLEKQVKVSETYLKLIQFRFGQGMVSALDVYQQRQQLAGTRAQIPLIESRIKVLSHKLAVLLGDMSVSSGQQTTDNSLPNLPDIPALGLPCELLRLRPDVQAAQFRVASADYRVGAAIADRFPSLRLSTSGGFRATEFARIFENLVWDILGSLSGTLWDGGRKSAETRRTRAVLEERIAKYVQTVLEAFQEVEDALVREQHQRVYLEKLTVQTDFARKSLEESRARYLNGLDDYLRVLTSLNAVQNLEKNLISAKKQLLSYRIQLHRALGINRQ